MRVHLIPRFYIGAFTVAITGGAWALISVSRLVSPDLLPSPVDVWSAGTEIVREGYRGTSLFENIAATLGRVAVGFGAATFIGVPLGLCMGLSRSLSAACNWIVQFFRPLPPLSYMILLILWLGTGDASKTTLLFLTALPIIVAATASGVRNASQGRVQAALALGANRRQVLTYVVLPSTMPMTVTGLQIAFAATFSTVVAAELMTATNGLGWMVISASHYLRHDVILLCIFLLGALGVGFAWLLNFADRSIIHWRGQV